MIKGKLQGNINIYSFQRKAQCEAPNYSIFNFKMPLGMSQSNLKRLSIGEDDEEVGVILGNKKMIDIKNTTIGFKGKKAMSIKFARNMIIKMIFPNKKDLSYTDWLKLSENYIYKIKPTYVMFPINKEFNINSFEGCNRIVQELNSALFLYSLDSDLIIYQEEETLSSLAYIISSLGYSEKLTLCLNLDYLQTAYDGLSDIIDDIYKFNICNRISMIYTSKYTDKSPVFNEFLSHLNEDVIVYGNNI